MPSPLKQMQTWQATVKAVQDHRDRTMEAIEPKLTDQTAELTLNVTVMPKAVLTETELKLTESPPEALVAILAVGYVTSCDVTKAFLRRAALAQKLVLPSLSIND
jgi:amidase